VDITALSFFRRGRNELNGNPNRSSFRPISFTIDFGIGSAYAKNLIVVIHHGSPFPTSSDAASISNWWYYPDHKNGDTNYKVIDPSTQVSSPPAPAAHTDALTQQSRRRSLWLSQWEVRAGQLRNERKMMMM